MKKFILIFVLSFGLLFSSKLSHAGWFMLGGTPDSMTQYYVETDSIKRDPNDYTRLSFTSLMNSIDKDLTQNGIASRVAVIEANCSPEDIQRGIIRQRTLKDSYHSEFYGKGKIISSYDDPSEWMTLPPGSLFGFIQMIVCMQD